MYVYMKHMCIQYRIQPRKCFTTFQPKCWVNLLELFEDLLLPTEEHSWLLAHWFWPTGDNFSNIHNFVNIHQLNISDKLQSKLTWWLSTRRRIRGDAVREFPLSSRLVLTPRCARGLRRVRLVSICQSEGVVSDLVTDIVMRENIWMVMLLIGS